jgi:glycerophosphoryl diester phosphodiesterase
MQTIWLSRVVVSVLALVLAVQAAPTAAFDLQGHRGARGLAPENTLAAFARALSIGVTTLELDTGVTKDGVVVVSHNPHLEPNLARDATGKWLDASSPAIHAMTLAEVKAYDVGRLKPGTRYAGNYPDQVAGDGQRVPTLAEVFELVKRAGNAEVRFNIETKLKPTAPDDTPSPQAFVEALLKVIGEHGVTGRVAIQSFDWRTLQEVQRQAPSVPTVYLTAQQRWLDNVRVGEAGPSPWTAGFDVDDFGASLPKLLKAAGGRVWSPYYKDVSVAAVKEAQSLGLQVVAWTVNAPDQMNALIDLGVDGIISDYPDRLRAVLEKRGMPVPKPTPVSP